MGKGVFDNNSRRAGQHSNHLIPKASQVSKAIMAFILELVEEKLNALLYQIAEDYQLDYEELSERYMGQVMEKPAPKEKVPRKKAEEKKKCCGKTAKGQPCKKNAADGSDYCKTHAPKEELEVEECSDEEGPKMCKGKTSKGQKCKKKAGSGSDYCKTHEPKEDTEEEEDEKVEMCQGVTGKKQPCKKKAVCDGYCKTHSKGPFKLKEPVHTHEPGEVDESCDSCSMYGDPVNGENGEIVLRRSERIKMNKLLENVEEEKMDGSDDETGELEDLESFAKALEEELAEEDF